MKKGCDKSLLLIKICSRMTLLIYSLIKVKEMPFMQAVETIMGRLYESYHYNVVLVGQDRSGKPCYGNFKF